jgi:monovalent cation:H+ antiporter-2, CPA2 family
METIGGPEQLTLIRDFAIIMAVAGVAVVIFKRLRQPSILGYLVAGVLVGPFTFPSPPVANIEIVRLLADLGLVLLLFAVGMEFGWRRIRKVGVGVLLIGTIEMLAMIALGYHIGKLLGWSPIEAIYLGSALAISSSAILVKVLRDSGKLTTRAGKLIVGLLVVEDFVAVILLTLLSGVATSGAADLGDVGPLVLKLVIFTVASVAIGAVVVPKLISYIHKFHSPETLVLAALALCFALALLGEELGLSAAAGAFLIGAVIGDTREAEQMTRTIAPIRDMFGALFFVSIGMLINVHVIGEHIVPALIISAVFIGGKVLVNIFGAFITGQPDRVPVEFGMRTPQMGEFSLAMVKVGVEHQTIGAFVYQVLAAVTAITALAYPYMVKSSDRVADLIGRRSPDGLRRYVDGVSVGARGLRSGVGLDPGFKERVRGPALSIVVNFLIIVVMIALGVLAVGVADSVAGATGISESLVASTMAFAALALSFPSGVAIWRSLERLTERTATHLVLRDREPRFWLHGAVKNVVRDGMMIAMIFVIGLWAIPVAAQVLSLGPLEVPLPFMVVAALVYVAIRFLQQVHGHLFETFSKTFVDSPDGSGDVAGRAGSGDGVEGYPPAPSVSAARRARPRVTVRSEFAPPMSSQLEMVMPSDGMGDNDAHSDRPAVGMRPVSIADAEISAMSAVEADLSPYGSRIGSAGLTWEFQSATEVDGHYLVKLRFRRVGAPPEEFGEEDVHVDKWGHVRVRQIRSWPKSGGHRFTLPFVYGSGFVVMALMLGTGLMYLLA